MSVFCPKCGSAYPNPTLDDCPEDGTRLKEEGAPDGWVGARIGDGIRIVDRIGTNRTHRVYEGVQRSIGRRVAVKVLRDRLSLEEFGRKRIAGTLRTLASLAHPNIVQPVHQGRDEERGSAFLVTELVPGPDLETLLHRGPLPPGAALDVVRQICAALVEAHASDIIHRDLKPSNVMLAPLSDGRILGKVLNFGFARALNETDQIDRRDRVAGTPAVMSPEHARGDRLTEASDLYSLGVILHESLSGEPLFEGSSREVLEQQVRAAPPRVEERAEADVSIPAPVQDLVDTLLSKRPGERPESAKAVRTEIAGLRDSLGLEPNAGVRRTTREEALQQFLGRARLGPDVRRKAQRFRSKSPDQMTGETPG